MKRGPTIVLIVIAAVLAAAAYFAVRTPTEESVAGAPFLPRLDTRANDVAAVEVLRGNATVRLDRTPEGAWVVASSDNFPAQTELVRALIVSLGSLTLYEPMTSKPDRHSELGLAWPDGAARSRRVRLLGADPAQPPIADVVLGDERAQPDTIYVRIFDQPATWRAKGRVQVQSDALGWIDRSLLTMPRTETMQATVRGMTFTRPENAPDTGRPVPWPHSMGSGAESALSGWTERQIDSAQIALPSFLERLEFDGVRKARADAQDDPTYSPWFETKGATVRIHARKDPDAVWFTLDVVPRPGFVPPPPSAQPTSEAPVPDYAAVAARAKGWEFRMPTWKSDALARAAAPDPPNLPAAPGASPPPGATEEPNK